MCSLLCVWILTGVSALAEETPKPITPEEAAKRINEKCVVQMEVKSTGLSRNNEVVFLNSQDDFRDRKNFTVMLKMATVEKLKKMKIEPATYYKGKTIQVTGTVTLYREKPEIVVEDAGQIKVVEKK
jgi:DNA/RNA endonuclease YhcR with UshA esterase domain